MESPLLKKQKRQFYSVEEVVKGVDQSQPWTCTPYQLKQLAMLLYSYVCDNVPEEVFHVPGQLCKMAFLDIEAWDDGMAHRQKLKKRMCEDPWCNNVTLHMCYGGQGVCCEHQDYHGKETCVNYVDGVKKTHETCRCRYPILDPCTNNLPYPCLDCQPDTRLYFLQQGIDFFQKTFMQRRYDAPQLIEDDKVTLENRVVQLIRKRDYKTITTRFQLENTGGRHISVSEYIQEGVSEFIKERHHNLPIAWLVGFRIMFGYSPTDGKFAHEEWPDWKSFH